VTHDDQHSQRPTGPTPEEISARLEALLKRTHALRRAQAASDATPHDGPTWPPHETDLDAVEVFAVPASRLDARGDTTTSAPSAPVPSPAESSATEAPLAADAPTPPVFGRSDWSTLRLRETPVEAPATPAWVWLVLAGLVIALGVESAYLLRTAPWASEAAAPVTLRIQGGPQLRVRVNDEAPQPLPLERAVNGDMLVLGVDVVTEAPDTTGGAGSSPGVQPAPPSSTAAPSATAVGAPASAGTSATTGAVIVESTPAGAIVTMGGYERGPTPITIESLRPGRHDVLVVGEGWRRALKVDVTAGTTARLVANGPSQP
jgi:hypothetical protein